MNEWKRSLLTGTIVALASQLYWNVFVSGFRISPAVILLPILLMTIGKSISTIRITVTTAAVVFLFRLFLAASGLSSSPETAGQLATNSIFYLCYGLLFSVLVPSKPTVSYRRLFPSVFICDLLSNLLEEITEKYWALQRHIRLLSIPDGRTRLEAYLRQEAGKTGEIVCAGMTRERMARYLGMNRSALSRLLGTMQREGRLELRRGSLRLLNDIET